MKKNGNQAIGEDCLEHEGRSYKIVEESNITGLKGQKN